MFNLREDHATIKFKVTQRFKDVVKCKLIVRKWAIINGCNIRSRKRTSTQLKSRYEDGYNWRLYGSMMKNEKTFIITTLMDLHTCYRVKHNRQVKVNYFLFNFNGCLSFYSLLTENHFTMS